MTSIPRPKVSSDPGPRPRLTRHRTRPAAVAAAATSIDFRSPIRVARIPEGMFVAIEPMPSSAPMRAAIEVLAPRSTALRMMTGSMDPSARPNRAAGP
jgi:hypothetical protein